MAKQTHFIGTQQEGFDLVNALSHNCDCKFGLMNVRLSTCVPHAALIADQRWIDALVFERRRFAIQLPDAAQRVGKLGELDEP